MKDEDSTLTTLTPRRDERSNFAKAYEDDTLFQLQERMLAKAKTKKFTAKQFADQAEKAWNEDEEVVESTPESFEETPEPEVEEELEQFF